MKNPSLSTWGFEGSLHPKTINKNKQKIISKEDNNFKLFPLTTLYQQRRMRCEVVGWQLEHFGKNLIKSNYKGQRNSTMERTNAYCQLGFNFQSLIQISEPCPNWTLELVVKTWVLLDVFEMQIKQTKICQKEKTDFSLCWGSDWPRIFS